jgi:hypothetical protein
VCGAKVAPLVRSTCCSRNYVVDFERVSFGSGFMAEPAAGLFDEHLLADFPVHSVVAFPA